MAILQRCCFVLLLWLVTNSAAIATERPPIVLFDEAHGEQFLPLQEGPLALSELGNILTAQGFEIRSAKEPLTSATLAEIDALVISGPFIPFSADEIQLLHDFVESGGKIAVMIHVAPVLSQLLERFGLVHSNGAIREEGGGQIAGEALNFRVTHLDEEPLFAGLDDFAAYGCWALQSTGGGARIVARSGDRAWIDLDKNRHYTEGDARESFGVVALGEIGSGSFVVFGDDAIFQNRFLSGSNRQLALNLAQRLKP